MMKSLMAVLVLSMALPVSARPSQVEDVPAPDYCSASAVYADGTFRPVVHVECDSPYAGECLQQVAQGQELVWKIVDADVCIKAYDDKK